MALADTGAWQLTEARGTPFLINLAPTGMVPTRELSAHVPLSTDEIVREVLACAEIGVAIVHLHVRDDEGRPSLSKDRYRRVIDGIRSARDDLIICVSCSGRGGATLAQRAEVLDLADDDRPDMASLTLSSLNFASQESVNTPSTIRGLLDRMIERGIKPELEVFDLGMANMARYYADRGLLGPVPYANILLGNIAGAQLRLIDAGALVAALPVNTIHSFAGLGAAQLPAAALAVASAGGVRIGLEDNLWYDAARQQPATNAGLVERVHRLAETLGRPVMSPREARALLGLGARG
jgi:uncharacterized protein (DUF849 family)